MLRTLQMLSGMLLILAIIAGQQALYVLYGRSLDSIHTQQTLARVQGFPDPQPVEGTRIAPARTGEPPVDGEPAHGDLIGWMRIPRFGVEWRRAIQEGTDPAVLDNQGIGHYAQTPMPGGRGNSSYAGHRTPGDLGPAGRLKPGDPIIIETAAHWYVYRVQASWMTTPDDVGVLDAQGDARIITITTCKDSLSLEDSLSARLIIRGRLQYWADVKDGIPRELAAGADTPMTAARAAVTRTIRHASVHAPVSRILAAILLGAWAALTLACRLIWRAHPMGSVSWNPLALIWRLHHGPWPLRVILMLILWMGLLFAQWAWLSPWLSTMLPMGAGGGAMDV